MTQLPREDCAVHRIPIDDPLADYMEAARRLKLAADTLATVTDAEALHDCRDLMLRRVDAARQALQAMVCCLEVV